MEIFLNSQKYLGIVFPIHTLISNLGRNAYRKIRFQTNKKCIIFLQVQVSLFKSMRSFFYWNLIFHCKILHKLKIWRWFETQYQRLCEYWIYILKIIVLCHLSPITCHIKLVLKRMREKNGKSCEASWWRVCYQRGLLSLVLLQKAWDLTKKYLN